jgi:hypothetical protein
MLFYDRFLVETFAFSSDGCDTGCCIVTARHSALWGGEQ